MAKTGLNVPIVTVLDGAGDIIEDDQRRVINHVVHQGRGADSLFLVGTTGEFDRITNRQRQRIIEIGCDEIRKINAHLPAHADSVEAWAGATAPTKSETLENISYAGQLGAEMAVVAPLAIDDLPLENIVEFFEREVAAQVKRYPDMGVALYDNPDIAAPKSRARNLPVGIVARLSELPFVVCLKASTSRDVLQDYLRVALGGDDRAASVNIAAPLSPTLPRPFEVFVGNAPLIFEYEEIQRAAGGSSDELSLAGVVSGPANLLPREWRAAWRAIVDRDRDALAFYRDAFARFDEMCIFGSGAKRKPKGIAAVKRALLACGIVSDASVAPGTAALSADEAGEFDERLREFLGQLSAASADGQTSLAYCSA